MTEVELVGGTIRIPGFAENNDVLTLTERIREDVDGTEVDIGIFPRGLTGRGTIEVPLRKLVNGGDGFLEGLQ